MSIYLIELVLNSFSEINILNKIFIYLNNKFHLQLIESSSS
jgi:hypothetical protein